jgi:hypothetical protein
MRLLANLSSSVAVVVLASCAAKGIAPTPARTQDLLLRSEPPGATCTVLQEGRVVATVEATPGVAGVPRTRQDIEIVCRKDGHLDERASYPPQHVLILAMEAKTYVPPSSAQTAAQAAAAALGLLGMVASMGVASPAAALLAGGLQASGAALGYAASDDEFPFAYEPVPVLCLVPATFESESARNLYFDSLKVVIETSGVERRARIDGGCFFFPCKPEEGPCRSLSCEKRRTQVEAETNARLARIPEQRAQTKVVAP